MSDQPGTNPLSGSDPVEENGDTFSNVGELMSLVFVVRSRSSLSHWSAMVPGDWETKEVNWNVGSPIT